MTINVWSDSMQHIELLGKPALFSDSRVDRSTVPDGWYVYDLRGSDYDPDLISTLEARVIVNYAGSILTPEPVIFPDGQDYLDVKGQTDFLDEEITLIDFCRQHEMPIPPRYQIRPASFDEAGLFYAMKPEEDQRLGCIGHVRMDFGHHGKEFWHTWWPRGAEELSKALGSRTVMSGSISRGKNDPSQSLQMMERPLMTPDELKSMPKGSFIVAKTGVHPMRVRLRLFLDWGIRFGEPYEVPEKAQRPVAYADKQELEEAIIRRHYASSIEDEENQVDQGAAAAGGLSQRMRPEANRRKPALRP